MVQSAGLAPTKSSKETGYVPYFLSEPRHSERSTRIPGEAMIRRMLNEKFEIHFVYPDSVYRLPTIYDRFKHSLAEHSATKDGNMEAGEIKEAIEVIVSYMNAPYVLDNFRNDDARDERYNEIHEQLLRSFRDKKRADEFRQRVWEVIKKDTLSLNFISNVYGRMEILWRMAVARYANVKPNTVAQLTDAFGEFPDIGEISTNYHDYSLQEKLQVTNNVKNSIKNFLSALSQLQERRRTERTFS